GVLVIFTLGKSPVFRIDRAGASIIGAIALIAFGVLSFDDAVKYVDFKTIVILFSMMIIVANLKLAGFFELLGNVVLQKVSTKKGLLFAVIVSSGVMSAIAINDIVCLLFTPVVLMICRKGQCNPLPHLLGLATASNIGSAATLLGNPQNILIASLSGLSFASYSLTAVPIAVLGLAANYFIILSVYGNNLQGCIDNASASEESLFHPYLIRKSLIVLFCVLSAYMLGFELVLAAGLGAAFLLITRRVNPNKVYTSVDFNLLVMFTGLFVIVGGVEKSGLMTYVMEFLPQNQINTIGFFAFLTLVLSNIVSNVPAVLLLKFFVPAADAAAWWKALALFSTLAGNLTITGSIANLIVVEIAKRQGVVMAPREYIKVGLPLTLITTVFGIVWLTFII
ncbi:MAG: Citrate transporter, partial [Firmicutes bacterium]|nr:Citrate transporter [Bacillota bacterium]